MAGFFETISGYLEPVTTFLEKNEALIGLGVTGASAYYAYDQQQDAIEASERAQNQALTIQREQADREKAMNRLQEPSSNASQLALFNQDTKRKLSDFMYEPTKASDRSSSGLNTLSVQKSLGLA